PTVSLHDALPIFRHLRDADSSRRELVRIELHAHGVLRRAPHANLGNADQFRRLIVAYKDGAAVRLGDLGTVKDDIQNNKTASWVGGERSIGLAVDRQPGTNTVAVATKAKAALAEIAKGLPPTLKLLVQYDRSVSIEQSV